VLYCEGILLFVNLIISSPLKNITGQWGPGNHPVKETRNWKMTDFNSFGTDLGSDN
jgi:hypothetical protein